MVTAIQHRMKTGCFVSKLCSSVWTCCSSGKVRTSRSSSGRSSYSPKKNLLGLILFLVKIAAFLLPLVINILQEQSERVTRIHLVDVNFIHTNTQALGYENAGKQFGIENDIMGHSYKLSFTVSNILKRYPYLEEDSPVMNPSAMLVFCSSTTMYNASSIARFLVTPTESFDMGHLPSEFSRAMMTTSTGSELLGLLSDITCRQSLATTMQDCRGKIQGDLEQYQDRVKVCMESMDSVERQFESMDLDLQQFDGENNRLGDVGMQLKERLGQAEQVIGGQKRKLESSLAAQKTLIQQLQESEAEARELQEFLHAEKGTLAEALKEAEQEMKKVEGEVRNRGTTVRQMEEQAGLLVRKIEQKSQELGCAKADINGVKDRAREMLLAQGAELSRASVAISSLISRLEQLVGVEGVYRTQQT